MPDVLPSCFGDHHGSHALEMAGGIRSAQNLVTCLYKIKLAGEYRLIFVTWFKTLMGQGLSVHVDDPGCQLTCNVDMKPWLFWKKQGCKRFEIGELIVEVMWDLSSAKYGSSPEPHKCYFVAIVCDQNLVLLLGDMQREALKKLHAEQTAVQATLLSRREHVSGKHLYTTRAQLFESGSIHDIVIECHTGTEKEPCLSICVDKQVVVQVKQLMWKFRGNQTIHIDGLPIEVFWDVHNWLFNTSDSRLAVFMFQTCKANEKPWLREIGVLSSTPLQGCDNFFLKNAENKKYLYQEGLCASMLHWPNSNNFKNKEPLQGPVGFSLLLYAWRNE